MKLKPGCEVEYEKRHRAIWPELVKLLKETGVSDYYIFWDKETNLLFAVQEQGGESGSPGSRHESDRKKMVGLHGRHHGRESGQLAGFDSAERGILHGIRPGLPGRRG